MTERKTIRRMRSTTREMGDKPSCVYTVGMIRLLLCCLVLDGDNARTLLGNTLSTALAGSLLEYSSAIGSESDRKIYAPCS
jgi:hypothetical protein